jgi:hypothetical protein
MYESDSNAFNHQVIRRVDFAIQSYGSIVTIDSHDQDMYDSQDQDIGHMDGRRYCTLPFHEESRRAVKEPVEIAQLNCGDGTA